jgi:hypothetical protein
MVWYINYLRILSFFWNHKIKIFSIIVASISFFFIIDNIINYYNFLNSWKVINDEYKILRMIKNPVYIGWMEELGEAIHQNLEFSRLLDEIEPEYISRDQLLEMHKQFKQNKQIIAEKQKWIEMFDEILKKDVYSNFLISTLTLVGVLGLSIVSFSAALIYEH